MATKAREPRQDVCISVRYRNDGGWTDAQIRNISSRGLMALCDAPPLRGSYVEIRRGSCVVVGRVAWSARDRFGLQSQSRIVPAELMEAATRRAPREGERRQTPRKDKRPPARQPSLAEREAASARFSRSFNFIAVAAIALGLAVAAASLASSFLGTPLEEVEEALSNPAGPIQPE